MRLGVKVCVKIIKLIVLLLCFSVQIHVKAEESRPRSVLMPNLVQEPRACLEDMSLVCGIKSQDKAIRLRHGGAVLDLAAHTILIRVTPAVWYLSKGHVWVEGYSDFQLKTQYGFVSPVGDWGSLLSSRGKEVVITPLTSPVLLSPSGLQKTVVVDPGLEITFQGYNQKGQASYEIPLSSQPRSVISRWSQAYSGNPAEFPSHVSEYLQNWNQISDDVVKTQQQIISRELASAEAKRRRQEERRRRYQEESRRMRALFRKKNYY